MNESSEPLQIPTIEPRFFLAFSLDLFAESDKDISDLLSTPDWHHTLFDLNANDEFLSRFTQLTSDFPNYPSDVSPEKRPINEFYFDKHSSISTEYSPSKSVDLDNYKLKKVYIRVFEHGGITGRCRFTQIESSPERGVDETVSVTRNLRETGREILHDAIQQFLISIDGLFESVSFSIPEGGRQIHTFEQYEYIDCDLSFSKSDTEFDLRSILNDPVRLSQLRELVGFFRMSKPYAWPDYSSEFLHNFISEKELGNRKDEVWFIYSQRFIRYFPDSQISETSSYVQDIVLGLENLLSLRALYKTLLESVRSNIPEIPSSIHSEGDAGLSDNELQTIQSQLSLLSYRFSRTVFPSDIRFYTQSPHANNVIEHLEKEMQLPELGTALETEMEKLQGTIDSFGTLITHHRDLSLQRRILIYTVVVGLVGAGVTLLNILI
jgi:hypothetical protein